MLNWWQQAVFYQIYPRSFADGNGDGIGDFKGIITKLDYLKDLGIDALWISPHYPSPQLDVGYDISNYVDVNPEYGTLSEFIAFLAQAHQRGIRVILDLVLNHTSHEHPWFIESASSCDNPKRDWYIWRDGKNGGPPNNWASPFDNSAWEWDEKTGQYYYHHFFKWQPDLNWRNPAVKKAMFDAVRFWLDLGVDGFRLDAISTIFEDPNLRDHECPYTFPELIRKVAPFYFGETTPEMQEQAAEIFKQYELIFQYQINQPGVHELMQELRALVDEYPDRVLVGETDDVRFYGDGSNELQMLFNFPLMEAGKLTADMVRKNQAERLPLIPPGAWAANTLNNHDGTRLMSRYADGKHDWEYARLGLALLLTLKGTPFVYNGEEIGMSNLLLDNLDDFRDLVGLHYYHLMVDAGEMPADEAVKMAARFTRDVCRTPMQWANLPNAGFSPPDVKTWLPVNPNYANGINVSDQLLNPASHLNFYKQLIALRKATPALMDGDYTPLLENHPDVCAFSRTSSTTRQTCLVLLNMSENFHRLDLNHLAKGAKKLYSSIEGKQTEISLNAIQLNAFEIFIGELIH